MALNVLYEDNHLLAVNKPVMLPTMGVAADRKSLLTLAKDYLREKYNKPGEVYLGVVSRLDAPVSGVVLIARTSKAAARLTKQFSSRSVQKIYWALVPGQIEPAAADLVNYVRKDERHRRMHITNQDHADAKEARLAYRTLQPIGETTLVEVQLETGRKHQIRLQLAHHGWPILGDRKYGSHKPFPAGIALHSRTLTFDHPVRHEPIELTAPLPRAWKMSGVDE